MAKNKQPNGQKFGPKMARALKLRCDALEDCVLSQQKVIEERTSEITNMRLSYDIMKRRHDDAMKFLELNRPEILQLMKAHAKHGALAAAGKLPSVTVKLVKRKRKVPAIPESELPLSPQQEFFNKMASRDPQTVAEVEAAADAFLKSHVDIHVIGDTASLPVPTGPKGPKGERWNRETRKFEDIV